MDKRIAPELLQRLRNNDPALFKLNLSSIKICSIGVKNLARSLRHNKVLQELNLHSNATGNVGVEHLAQSLRHNSTWRKLDLVYNNIQSVGLEHLSQALRYNNNLRESDTVINKLEDGLIQKKEELQNIDTQLEQLKKSVFDRAEQHNLPDIKSLLLDKTTVVPSSRHTTWWTK